MPLGKPLLDALDGMGYGGLLLNAAGEIVRLNSTAAKLLTVHMRPAMSEGDLNSFRHALNQLLSVQANGNASVNQDCWIAVPQSGRNANRPMIIRSTPIDSNEATGTKRVVMLIDLNLNPEPSVDVLRRIFQLTPSEGRLAVEMASGKSPDEVAEAAQISVSTVRKQLNSVFTKTSTHRQAELVALLARLAILP
ncbi:helix-turn-helix transcriptional regulator [Methylobacterium durans]|uniref:helix-turn-helix transcriptional regulator n=1 Tax=Methylobacterium durans TaxID=2202825 RepID=UPI002AFFFEB4|nr:helix-turn-helix transcriptional regulator [Methylobacterium durans]MEA1832340.1 helix-turn-helix transcriptional regulator [Methylobacterium durans]